MKKLALVPLVALLAGCIHQPVRPGNSVQTIGADYVVPSYVRRNGLKRITHTQEWISVKEGARVTWKFAQLREGDEVCVLLPGAQPACDTAKNDRAKVVIENLRYDANDPTDFQIIKYDIQLNKDPDQTEDPYIIINR